MANDEMKNFKWTRDGTILVLALYKEYHAMHLHSQSLGKKIKSRNPNDKIWIIYNSLIRNLPDEKGICSNQNVRIENYFGVENKYEKFVSLNEDDVGRKVSSEDKITADERKIWNEFKDEFEANKIHEEGELEKEELRIINLIYYGNKEQ